MKKLLAALALAALAPITSFAISIDELNNNPEKYKKVTEGVAGALYVDTYSVKSLRYSPPFYTMRGNVYLTSYTGDFIAKLTLTVDYDYNRSGNTLDKLIEMRNNQKDLSKEQRRKEVIKEIAKDSGMTFSKTNVTAWHINGTSPMKMKDAYNKPVTTKNWIYLPANYLFYQYYEQPFQLDFSKPIELGNF